MSGVAKGREAHARRHGAPDAKPTSYTFEDLAGADAITLGRARWLAERGDLPTRDALAKARANHPDGPGGDAA